MANKDQVKKKKTQLNNELDKLAKSSTDSLVRATLGELSKGIIAVQKAKSVKEAITKGNQIRSALESEAVNDQIDKLSRVYTFKIKQNTEQIALTLDVSKSLKPSAAEAKILSDYVGYDIDKVKNRLRGRLEEVYLNSIQAKIAGVEIPERELFEGFKTKSEAELESFVNTSLQAFENVQSRIKGQELGTDLFLYVGGLIDTSRPFCIERDDKVFSLKEIDSWDNGTPYPAAIYLGGYNCRHSLQPISLEIAQEEYGYKV